MEMSKIMIIGATGGVGSVVTQKCSRSKTISEIVGVNTNPEKYKALNKLLASPIDGRSIDVSDYDQIYGLIRETQPGLVLHSGLPYDNLIIMEACHQAGAFYLDTANYEEGGVLRYDEQWGFHEKFRKKGLMALLGCGFDPGVTNIFCAYALKNYFREIHAIDIMDCNGGDHGKPFASNFNLVVNLCEFLFNRYCYWHKGKWIRHAPLWSPKSVHQTFDFDQIGPREMYAIFHEEMDSLRLYIPGLKRMRFWMTFEESYLRYLRMFIDTGMASIHKWRHGLSEISPRDFLCTVARNKRVLKKYAPLLESLGLLSDEPIKLNKEEISPLEFLQKVLPAPASLGEKYTGKTNIGVRFEGISKSGYPMKYYVYNICDHQEDAFKDCRAQAVSYTAGVPAMVGAEMILQGRWVGRGVFHPEQFDPDPFMYELSHQGLSYTQKFGDEVPDLKF